jgi:hypothetical protein
MFSAIHPLSWKVDQTGTVTGICILFDKILDLQRDVMNMGIFIFHLRMGGQELDLVLEAFASTYFAPIGQMDDNFERGDEMEGGHV